MLTSSVECFEWSKNLTFYYTQCKHNCKPEGFCEHVNMLLQQSLNQQNVIIFHLLLLVTTSSEETACYGLILWPISWGTQIYILILSGHVTQISPLPGFKSLPTGKAENADNFGVIFVFDLGICWELHSAFNSTYGYKEAGHLCPLCLRLDGVTVCDLLPTASECISHCRSLL